MLPLGTGLLCASLLLGNRPGPAGEEPDFAREVAPILRAHCVECHGEAKHKGGLRLDRRSEELFGPERALVPGDPAASELFRRVTSSDPEERMPERRAPLAAPEIETLRRWIAAGAPWPAGEAGAARPPHWAYQPIAAPVPPAVSDPGWPLQPLDRFVLAALEADGLRPAPRAEPGELLRRAALDLTGIPPTEAELDAFERDPSRAAFAAAVERMLASPRYGERMAQWWLDLARYADTNGYEKDAPRSIWPWRDWVVDAFARDLPFDRFTLEQLAGDLLPGATRAQRVATGFQRNTMINEEGGTDDEEFRVAAVVDRVNTLTQVWLGSTLACAQCHDHKYDPFSQREYYALFAFLDRTEDGGKALAPLLALPSPDEEREEARRAQALAEAERAASAAEAELAAEQAAWEEAAAAALGPEPRWEPIVARERAARSGARLETPGPGAFLVRGEAAASDVYTLRFRCGLATLAALRIEALPAPELPLGGASRAANANFSLTGVRLARLSAGRASAPRPIVPDRADASRAQAGSASSATNVLDEDAHSGWIVDGPAPAELVLGFDEPLALDATTELELVLAFESPWPDHALGSFRVQVSDDAAFARSLPKGAEGLPWAVRAALRLPPAEREEAATALLAADFRKRVSARAQALDAAVAAARTALEALRSAIPTTPVLVERAEPRVTHVLGKGSFLAPGEVVEPDVPAVLPPLPAGAPRDRLGLARWLVAPENPLTARVLANRLWERLFGRGIVATLDDFGTRGEPPSQPALLEHLATRLVELGWSLKAFQRELVLSAAYAQSSCRPDPVPADAPAAELARAARPRLEIETLRDQALSLAGLLVERVGGPSVRPPQPANVESHVYSDERWVDSTGPDRYRRGLYTFWKRSSPYGTFATFDAPSRELACTRRARTNTPLQALALLNDPAFDECARAFARRLLADEALADDGARLAAGFRRCTARRPSQAELDRLLALLADERADAATRPEAELAPDEREPRAWARIATVLLNLDETLCRN